MVWDPCLSLDNWVFSSRIIRSSQSKCFDLDYGDSLEYKGVMLQGLSSSLCCPHAMASPSPSEYGLNCATFKLNHFSSYPLSYFFVLASFGGTYIYLKLCTIKLTFLCVCSSLTQAEICIITIMLSKQITSCWNFVVKFSLSPVNQSLICSQAVSIVLSFCFLLFYFFFFFF